ncbi:DUF6668 family protein [Ancrocorticia populi]|uniref:DUF6668 family protein n=1 Tax=Ancrocorticia populi TaxID=2175228 RepID=UPI003F95B90B
MSKTATARKVEDTSNVPETTRKEVSPRVNIVKDKLLEVAEKPLWERPGRPPVVWLLGAHGGAGTTTLAESWAPAAEAKVWPAKDDYPYVVIVCRSTRTGLDHAHELVLQATGKLSGDCELLGVAVVADAPGKTPKALRQRMEVLGNIAPHIWEIPYIAQLREARLEDLPEWNPQDGPAEQQTRHPLRRRRIAPMTTVDQHLAFAGEGIFNAARNAHSVGA